MTLTAILKEHAYRINLIPAQFCVDVWPDIRGYLQPAVERSGGRWTMEHILSGLLLGQQGLWVIKNNNTVAGVLTTEIVNYPAKKMLAIHFLGGEQIDAWYWVMSDALVQHAQRCGCAGIETSARAGFWKWFKQDGFVKSSVFYERSV